MATKPTKRATAKRPEPKSRVRQATVKEAIEWLNMPAAAAEEPRFRRVITAIRDPQNAHIFKTIVIHE